MSRDELISELRRIIAEHEGELHEAVFKYGLPPECEPRMPAAIEAFTLVLLDEPLLWIEQLAAEFDRRSDEWQARAREEPGHAATAMSVATAYHGCAAELRARAKGGEQ